MYQICINSYDPAAWLFFKNQDGNTIVAEVRNNLNEKLHLSITNKIKHTLRTKNLEVKEVGYVAPGWLPRTTSGKIQRWLCQKKWEKENI